MKYTLMILLCCVFANTMYGQMKYLGEATEQPHHHNTAFVDAQVLMQRNQMAGNSLTFNPGQITRAEGNSAPIYIDLSKHAIRIDQERVAESVIQILHKLRHVLKVNPSVDLLFDRATVDQNGNRHIRYHQYCQGIRVRNATLIAHMRGDDLSSITGRWHRTPTGQVSLFERTTVEIDAMIAKEVEITPVTGLAKQLVPDQRSIAESVVYIDDSGTARHAYEVEVYPNPGEHWHILFDAETGDVLQKHEAICRLHHMSDGIAAVVDGDVQANGTDLADQGRQLRAYQVGPDYFMLDASRGMYNDLQSSMPDEPMGVIWTIDANGTAPQNQNFSVSHVHSTNNTWAPLEVSAHWNSTKAFEYFEDTFARNSINGAGGNIISIINVVDENENAMDNAFWNGYAMFYGNGDEAFSSPLARGLDVAGHEMSHGTIQNTANLEYLGQSGALNESFADVFGAMIDRDDWQIGEDVVNTGIFQSGALRDLQNPNNGGTGLSSPGWQPAHMDEYQNLPLTPQGDNGGVHVNSGIPNRAFFLFANSVGKSVAEQVYYHALTNYLVRSSQFIDARIAVVQSAVDLHSGNPAIAQAARAAFDGVGILDGSGSEVETDIETNPGDGFILLTDNSSSALFFVDPSNGNVEQLNAPAPRSRPSFTDDGSLAVYVDENLFLKAILFDWSAPTLTYEVIDLETTPQPIWRNIVVSKDGSKIAYLTDQLTNALFVYDFESAREEEFALYNPTSGGVTAGGVLYADVMEWDYTGETVMYDALNQITGNFGNNIRYWDISFIDVWNNDTEQFADGLTDKLFTSLPENVSVGNATFSKNSPYIIAYDYIESTTDIFGDVFTDYFLRTANIQTGRVVNVFRNDTLSYPSYGLLDNIMSFDSKDPDDPSSVLVAAIDMQENDKMLPVTGTERIFINSGHLATWFLTGARDLTSGSAELIGEHLNVAPNPATDHLYLALPEGFQGGELKIYDIQGVQRYSTRVGSSFDGRVDLPAVVAGMYFVVVETPGKRLLGKVMLSKD